MSRRLGAKAVASGVRVSIVAAALAVLCACNGGQPDMTAAMHQAAKLKNSIEGCVASSNQHGSECSQAVDEYRSQMQQLGQRIASIDVPPRIKATVAHCLELANQRDQRCVDALAEAKARMAQMESRLAAVPLPSGTKASLDACVRTGNRRLHACRNTIEDALRYLRQAGAAVR